LFFAPCPIQLGIVANCAGDSFEKSVPPNGMNVPHGVGSAPSASSLPVVELDDEQPRPITATSAPAVDRKVGVICHECSFE
jgi:hypothetical protein